MADSILVQTQVLVDTATKIRATNDKMDSYLQDISGKMSALAETWESSAGTEIRSAMESLKAKYFADYKKIIESYANFLDFTAREYETTETTVKSNAGQFK